MFITNRVEKLAAGDATADLLKAYPNLKEEDIVACLLFAADSVKNELKGFEVISVLEYYSGVTDQVVLKIAVDKQCLLITEDKDFGELTYRLKLKHYGILLIRLNDLERRDRIETVSRYIEQYFDKLNENFTVLTKRGLRIKKSK